MKKIVLAVACCFIIAMCAVTLGGCSWFGEEEDKTYYEVSSVDDLSKMESKKNYKLTADIDFNGLTWTPKKVKNFDGQGHTISNVMIIGSNKCAFFTQVGVLRNLTLTDVVGTGTDNGKSIEYRLAVAVGDAEECDSVTVKDSSVSLKITLTQTYGYELSKNMIFGGAIVGHCGSMKNCVAENCEISAESNTYNQLDLGGLAGYTSAVKDSIAKKIKVSGKSNSVGNYGGIAGSCSSVKNSVSRDCNISGVCAKSSDPSRVGGLVGHAWSSNDGGITNCASIANTLRFSGESQYTVGGFVGKTEVTVGNCFVSGNSITANITASSSKNSMYAGVFAGSATAAVSKCVAQSSTLNASNISTGKYISTSEFVAYAEASIVKCGIMGNTVFGSNQCKFANDSSYVKDCISYSSPDDDDWKDVISALSLDDELWTMTGGALRLEVAK